MARDVLTVTAATRNQGLNLGSIAAPANGAAFTQANGQSIPVKRGQRLGLLIYNSKAGAIVVTVKAGVSPPSESAGLGDLTITVPTTAFFTMLTGLESGRFTQADGNIYVDTDASATGTMWAFEMPA